MRVILVLGIFLGTALFACLFGSVSTVSAVSLILTIVGAPDINCKFDTDCRIFVNDFSDHFILPGAAGDAFLQSRSFPEGQPLTEGEGLFAYLYRIDLRELAGILQIPCISQFKVAWVGGVVPLDYDNDSQLEDVFVVTSGGLGTVAPIAAEKTWHTITFTFNPLVCAGSSAGGGDSTFFFGLASSAPPQVVTARLMDLEGGVTVVQARSPGAATFFKIKELVAFVQSLSASDFSNRNYQNTLINKMKMVEEKVEDGVENLCGALNKLSNDILQRTDWMSNRAAQMQFQEMVTDIIRSIRTEADGLKGCQ